MQGNDEGVVRQSLAVWSEGRQSLAGSRVIQADGQVVDLGEIVRGKGVNVLNDCLVLPGGSGIVAAYRRAVGLTAYKAVRSAKVDKDGVGGWRGSGGLPIKCDLGGIGNW